MHTLTEYILIQFTDLTNLSFLRKSAGKNIDIVFLETLLCDRILGSSVKGVTFQPKITKGHIRISLNRHST